MCKINLQQKWPNTVTIVMTCFANRLALVCRKLGMRNIKPSWNQLTCMRTDPWLHTDPYKFLYKHTDVNMLSLTELGQLGLAWVQTVCRCNVTAICTTHSHSEYQIGACDIISSCWERVFLLQRQLFAAGSVITCQPTRSSSNINHCAEPLH